jgi:hypothetical protein
MRLGSQLVGIEDRYSLHWAGFDTNDSTRGFLCSPRSQHLLSLQKILGQKILYSNSYVEFCWGRREKFLEKIWE